MICVKSCGLGCVRGKSMKLGLLPPQYALRRGACRLRSPAGLPDVGRHQSHVVGYREGLAFHAAVDAAERDDEPIGATVLLHAGAEFGFLVAAFFRTVGRQLAARSFPMIKPAAARAVIVAGTVDVGDPHGLGLGVFDLRRSSRKGRALPVRQTLHSVSGVSRYLTGAPQSRAGGTSRTSVFMRTSLRRRETSRLPVSKYSPFTASSAARSNSSGHSPSE